MNEKQANMHITLGYWNVRGRGEPIRLLLNYLNLKYTDKVYYLENRQEWLDFKWKSTDLFINLPYMEISQETDVEGKPIKQTFVESDSICLYICKQFGGDILIPQDIILMSKIRGIVDDVKQYLSRFAYHSDTESAENIFLIRLFSILDKLNKHISLQNPFLCGSQLSYLDFIFYESLKTLEKINIKYLENYPQLNSYMHIIQNIPQIKDYLNSNRFHSEFLFYGDPSKL